MAVDFCISRKEHLHLDCNLSLSGWWHEVGQVHEVGRGMKLGNYMNVCKCMKLWSACSNVVMQVMKVMDRGAASPLLLGGGGGV